MAVYEIKNYQNIGTPVRPKRKRREITPTLPIKETRSIDHLLDNRKWWERNGKKRKSKMVPLDHEPLQRVKKLVEKVNEHLVNCRIPVELIVAEDDGQFGVDVYDISVGHEKQLIQDVDVSFNDLPLLLRSLQQEAGIMLDKVL